MQAFLQSCVRAADQTTPGEASLIVLLPRITTSTLTAQDAGQLDLVDLTALGTEVLVFFHQPGGQGEPAPIPRRVEDAMDLQELMAWRERARQRHETA